MFLLLCRILHNIPMNLELIHKEKPKYNRINWEDINYQNTFIRLKALLERKSQNPAIL